MLQAKDIGTYTALFESVQARVPDLQPTFVLTDFESAAIQSIKAVYPNIRIAGCLFHFSQSIQRKIQTLGALWALYLNNEEFKIQIKTLSALAFVPIEHVYRFFCISMERLNVLCNRNPQILGKRLFVFYILNVHLIRTCMVFRYNLDRTFNCRCSKSNSKWQRGIHRWIHAKIIQENAANREALFELQYWNVLNRLVLGTFNPNLYWIIHSYE